MACDKEGLIRAPTGGQMLSGKESRHGLHSFTVDVTYCQLESQCLAVYLCKRSYSDILHDRLDAEKKSRKQTSLIPTDYIEKHTSLCR